MKPLVGEQVVVVECRGGTAPGLTHARCRRAQQSSAHILIVLHRRNGLARLSMDFRRGGLSPARLTQAIDLLETVYPVASWGRGGAVASLIEVGEVPLAVLPQVLNDLRALCTLTPEDL